METGGSKTYHKVTTSLTAEQHEWVRRVAAQAQLEGVSITAADAVPPEPLDLAGWADPRLVTR